MKFTVTMKDPEILHDAINRAVARELGELSLTDDERYAVAEMRRARVAELCSQWFKWSEYLSVEVDTEARTCTVLGADAIR